MGKVGTEATLKVCEHYLRIIAESGEVTTLTDWQEAIDIVLGGHAKSYFPVGTRLEEAYSGVSDRNNEWIVAGYKSVELDDGETYNDVPILVMAYATPQSCQFDEIERIVATETTAQDGVYYFGSAIGPTDKSTTGWNDPASFVALNLTAGDTIDYSAYTYIYKHKFANGNYAIARGRNQWATSFIRQWLNSAGTNWAHTQDAYDVLPSNAASTIGFLDYLPNGMVKALHKVKISTKQATYVGGGTDVTYDKFFLLSPSEMNIYNGNASEADGDPLDYYVELIGKNTSRTDGKQPAATYTQLINYALNAPTSALHYWLRSAYLGASYEWFVASSGYVIGNLPCDGFRAVPACALI